MSTTQYEANTRDAKFILWEQLGIQKLFEAEKYQDFDEDTINMVLDEAGKFAEQELSPANSEGDSIGCKFEDGKVIAPEIFRPILQKFRDAGWVCLTSSPEVGGQGLPYVVSIQVNEFFIGANFNFCSYPMLGFGAGHLIESFGTEMLKEKYMLPMYRGEFGGTMCLTEPQAGSDLSLVRTTAKPMGDHYLISGTKQFITSGDHNLMDNIVHPVLARIEGAPAGTKGISLILVPKFLVNEDGSIGEPNDVNCVGIEKKIGLHGSSTCVLNFGEEGKCKGWLLGKENKGLQGMFQLMNEARVEVGLQGVAQSSAAYLNSLAYAKERLQGSDFRAFKDPNAPRVEIIKHPDVRRNLLMMKAYVEGMRSLLMYTSYALDLAHILPDEEERKHYHYRAELLTPICKAYCSDIGFKVIEAAIQVFGGVGLTKDYPVEQYLRDCKIAAIYEGTNGIQALDLLVRKLGMKKGTIFMTLMQEIGDMVSKHENDPELGAAFKELSAAKDKLSEIVMHIGGLTMSGEMEAPMLNAYPFLMMFGDVVLAWLLLWQATIAKEKLPQTKEGEPDFDFYTGKVAAAKFFTMNLLPEIEAKYKAIMAGDKTAMELPESAF